MPKKHEEKDGKINVQSKNYINGSFGHYVTTDPPPTVFESTCRGMEFLALEKPEVCGIVQRFNLPARFQ